MQKIALNSDCKNLKSFYEQFKKLVLRSGSNAPIHFGSIMLRKTENSYHILIKSKTTEGLFYFSSWFETAIKT